MLKAIRASAVVAKSKTAIIDSRKADDISKSFAKNGPSAAACDRNPIWKRGLPQMAPTLHRIDAADHRRSGRGQPRIRQVPHDHMHHGKEAAGERRDRQQLNY